MKKLSIAVLAVAAAVAISPLAKADTATVYSTPLTSGNAIDSTQTLTVAQFDNGVGGAYAGDTLNSVEIILSGSGSTRFYASLAASFLDPTATGSATIDSLSTNATLTLTGSVPNLNLVLSGTETLTPPVTLAIGGTTVYLEPTPTAILGTSVHESIAGAGSGFAGSGVVDFSLAGTAPVTAIDQTASGLSLSTGGLTTADGSVEVIYTYSTPQNTVTPEPSSMFLLGTGLLGLAGLAFSKKNGLNM